VSALAEALLAAQRQAIGALGKSYLAGLGDEDARDALRVSLDAIGCTDKVEQDYLCTALEYLRQLGTAPVANGKPDPASEPASERQTAYIKSLADDRNMIAPDGPLTKEQASKVIEQLKAGTYNADEWTAPF
jgi:hypothetical protein